jgi:outer membrane protein assembly factor BamB
MKPFLGATMLAGALWLAADGQGGDWPQYRCDAARSAASAEQLPDTLHLDWVRQMPTPRPAFAAEVRLRYDATYEPVVLGKTMFVPSMVSDCVTALDTDTGAERWRFFAEGPVRFAPVAWGGNVYFTSDDGHLYCLAAADGKLRWKFAAQPPGKSDRKLLGSGRLIGLWPARGGPVLRDGIVYFGAGLWASYGVAVHAINAETGKAVWSNSDSDQIPKANMDHGIAHFAGLTPQGYLAIVGEKLVVPCGAQLPAFLNLANGKLDPYTMGWGGRNGLPKGTWFVAGTRNYLSHGGDLYDLARPNDEMFTEPVRATDFKGQLYAGGFTRVQIDPTNQKDLGAFREPVFSGDTMYDNDRGVAAFDLASGKLEARAKLEVPAVRRDDTYPDNWTANFRELWRLPSKLKVHIQAGEHLYLGGTGTVEAVRIPKPGDEPRVVWHASVEGTPHRMLAADGRLFVATREGAIYAFGSQKKASPTVHAEAAATVPPADAWTHSAADILRATKTRDGYAVALGIGSGRLIEELVRRSNLDVIAIAADAQQAAALRERLHRAGLYGTRISIHVGDPLKYPLPPYLASLVVAEDWAALGSPAGRAFIQAVFHPLRPYGGTACLAIPAAQRDALMQEIAQRPMAGAAVRAEGDWTLLSRVGPLPGSSDWTHADANAANTGASTDQFVKVPLEMLWFDSPPRWIRTPDSTLVRVCGGRMFLKAAKLTALDVYTGRRLWEAKLPFAHNAADQLVAVEDAVYVAGGATCVAFDPVTGEKTTEIALPPGLSGNWANLRVWQDYLIGQCGKRVVCINRRNGQAIWDYECGRASLSVAVGGGKVFCAELAVRGRAEPAPVAATTRALDLKTGQVVWQAPGGSEVRYSPPHDMLVTWSGVYRGADGQRAFAWPEPPQTDPKAKPQAIPRPRFVVGRSVLVGTAESFTAFDLLNGAQQGELTTWVTRGCTVPRASTNLLTTRYRGNAACIDLASRSITSFWNVRAACANNIYPADGVLSLAAMMGGCTCNYMPVSQAFVPAEVISRVGAGPAAGAE